MQTIYACFIGYIVQAIVNNFVPLLFVTFQNNYYISLERITFLITLNFIIQLFVDLLSAFFIDRIGYRISILIAHILSLLGACGRCSVINRIFLVFRNIALENPRTYVGCHPNI